MTIDSSAPDRRLAPEDQLEIERDRRRRVTAALLSGEEARPATMPPGPWWPLVAAAALAAFIALSVGLGTLIRDSLPGGRPAAHPSPTVSAPAPPRR